MSFADRNPFFGDVPRSVHLPKTPLTGVLVQLRFPEILSITKPEFIADFQEQIRESYPQHVQQESVQLILGSEPENMQHSRILTWCFLDASRRWRVNLTTKFLSLETRAYTSRDDFADRISTLAKVLQQTIRPGFLVRLGVRYIDRIHGAQFTKLKKFVRPEILGIFGTELKDSIDRSISEVHARTKCGEITARWGYMPSNQTHEPSLMPAIAVNSWFLDIDTYKAFNEPIDFNADDIRRRTMQLATRSHGFFRWAVNDDFLKSYGGTL